MLAGQYRPTLAYKTICVLKSHFVLKSVSSFLYEVWKIMFQNVNSGLSLDDGIEYPSPRPTNTHINRYIT